MFYPTLDVTSVEPLDVLAVAAHPGDAEWFCGGTLAKVSREGRRVGVLDLTTGDMSARGIPQQRVAESEAAAKHLGLAWRGVLGLPDGRLENNILARMTLAGILRALRPQVAIGPHPSRSYPDHRYTWELLRDASEAAGWPKLDDDLVPHRPALLLQGLPDTPLSPTCLLSLSAEDVAAKTHALLCYESQMQPEVHPADPMPFPSAESLRQQVESVSTAYGRIAGLRYAEPFYAAAPIRLDSLNQWLSRAE
jgi:bacillithiol biosynthesis deacetylase BshB1